MRRSYGESSAGDKSIHLSVGAETSETKGEKSAKGREAGCALLELIYERMRQLL